MFCSQCGAAGAAQDKFCSSCGSSKEPKARNKRGIKTDTGNGKQICREGRVVVAGHFEPVVQTALRLLAAEEGTTIQALLAEGINMVLAARGKPQVASSLERRGGGRAALVVEEQPSV